MFQTTNPCDFMNFGGFNLPQTTKNIGLSMPFQTSILKASGGFIVRAIAPRPYGPSSGASAWSSFASFPPPAMT